ncbi:hypothetical protein BDZ45DRAFT_744835 [Acephala macrosclerotiorum]|nr:hypothetical protein BDZ45DRAFT_744835 [Acephala macrosclerotiorum]
MDEEHISQEPVIMYPSTNAPSWILGQLFCHLATFLSRLYPIYQELDGYRRSRDYQVMRGLITQNVHVYTGTILTGTMWPGGHEHTSESLRVNTTTTGDSPTPAEPAARYERKTFQGGSITQTTIADTLDRSSKKHDTKSSSTQTSEYQPVASAKSTGLRFDFRMAWETILLVLTSFISCTV